MTPLILTAAALSMAAPPQPAVGIPVHAVHAALDGRAPAPDLRVLQAPPELGPPLASPAMPSPDKLLYGTRMDNHVDSENFTVAWRDGDGSVAVAEQASEAMEAAWQVFIDDQGWRQPVSSDQYMLWVLLDPGLSGTGLTTEYSSGDFPDGYPVIFLNPGYAHHSAFFDSLCTHELAHAIQYALRDWDGSDADSWYWEASAEWMSEQARPELNVYAWSVYYYSTQPWFRFDSTDNQHQYGMSVVNAYIEEVLGDGDSLRSTWELSEQRTGVGWDLILAESIGIEAAEIWGGFSGAMANGQLRESAIYEPVLIDGPVSDGLEGEVAMLGTDYFSVTERVTVSVEALDAGGVVLASGPHGHGASVQVEFGDVVGIVGASEPTARYRISVGAPVDVQDTADTGFDTPTQQWGERQGGCGCGSPAAASGWLLGLPLLLGIGRRRRRR